MGAASSAVNLGDIKLTEEECKAAMQQLFEKEMFQDCADSDNLAPLDTLRRTFEMKTDVFLTHDWGQELGVDNHERVNKINEALKKRGLLTWFDSDKLEGNVKKKMIQGIENAYCIVVFVTKKYMDKVNGDNAEDNCQLEFNYSSRRKTAKRMVPVVMEERMRDTSKWKGEVGMVLGGTLYVDVTSDNESFEARMDELYYRILRVTGVRVQEVKESAVWADFIHKKVQEMGQQVKVADTVAFNGKTIVVTGEATQGNSANVFLAFGAVENWLKQDRHRYDLRRNFDEQWLCAWAFDWARQPKGYCVDANKSVKIGVGKYDANEDPTSAQIIIIRHFDSERPGNYEKHNNWGDVPPVWAFAFSAEELKVLAKEAIAHSTAPYGTLIHREPEGDIEPNEPWFSESHWLVEEGKVTGIRVLTKCTQDKEPTTHIVRFKVRGSTFELVGTETIVPAVDQWQTSTKALPSPCEAIIPSTDYLLPVTAEASVPAPEGESALVVRVQDGSQTSAYNYHNSEHLCQSLTSPLFTINNPTDKRIAVVSFIVEFLNEKGEWVLGSSPRIGTQYSGYFRDKETSFADVQSFEVESHASIEVVFQGTFQLPLEGRTSYNGCPQNQRVHTAFPHPLQARVICTDDAEAKKTAHFSFTNTPLDEVWLTYDEAVATADAGEGFGPHCQADLWLCVENPIDLNKCIICVTTKKEDPHEWFIRMSYDRRNVGVGTYQSIDYAYLCKMAFKDSLKPAAERKEEIDFELSDCQYCKLTGLIDLQTNQIYALHGVIHVEHEGKTIAKKDAYLTLDYTRVTPAKE